MEARPLIQERARKLVRGLVLITLIAIAVTPPKADAAVLRCSALFRGDDAGSVQDDSSVSQSANDRLLDQMAAADELFKDQAARAEARRDARKIEKLEKRIVDLRKQNGIWETSEITDKRMNALTFETFIMLDDTRSIQAHFGTEFAATERSAIRYLTSEAIIKAYRQKVADGVIDPESGRKLIEIEERDLELAKNEFLAYAEKTMSLAFVLDVMKESGAIVDVSTLFGGRTKTTDIRGKAVQAPPPAPPAEMMLESAMMPDIEPPSQNSLKELEEQMLSQVESEEEIRQRARKIDETFGKYMTTEPVRELITRAQKIIGPDFQMKRPTLRELSKLRSRLGPDWDSTANILARRKEALRNEAMLRWKLRLLGPQLFETITTWIGKSDGKYRKALIPLARLAGLEYDNTVRRRHLAKILKVLSIQSPKTQLTELLEGSGQNPYAEKGELIVTFIRFTRARDDWNRIKEMLEQSKSSYDKKLIAELDRYEEEALRRGPISLIGPISDPIGSAVSAGTVASVIALGSGGAGWIAEKAWLQVQVIYTPENIHSLLHLVHLAGQ